MTTRLPSPWRDLPKELGNWHSVYVRFSRWEQYGVWHRVAGTLQNDADLEELFIDATIVCAHQHANISHFSAAFRKRFGVNPGAIRN